MADGVEDPVEGEAKLACGAFAGAFQTLKNGLEATRIEVTPHIDDADGDEDLSMDDALRGELLHHVPGDDLIVFRVAEAAGDGLEGLNEFSEIGETIERLGVVLREWNGVVTGAELDQCGGRDGAFEMQMQLGLGQAADEGLDRGHNFSLV